MSRSWARLTTARTAWHSPRARAGSVFVIADKATTRTLGVTIVGENSSEMIAMATSAVADGLTTEQWEKMIVAHPSLCEMVREAALDAFGKSVHK